MTAKLTTRPNPHYIRTIPDTTWKELKRRADSLGLSIGAYIAVLVEEDEG